MLTQIDHLVILVRDLEQASEDYEDLGFNVMPGGKHADGLTRNALIPFEDGSYLELVAFLNPEDKRDNIWGWRSFLGSGVGLLDYCVASDDLEEDVRSFQERGLSVSSPEDGGRQLPDGTELRWRIARFEQSGRVLPFLIEDLTDRTLRVPNTPATVHPNGSRGVSDLTLAVSDLRASTGLLGSLTNDAKAVPEFGKRHPRFAVGDQALILTTPENAEGPIRQRLNAAGDGPFSITLSTYSEDKRLNPPGARIFLKPSS
ncbi:MAG: VOC family protein [Rubrobacteraceae bacterium]